MCFISVKKIRFYREDGRWYADIQGQSKEDNEMIDGCDSVLELLYNKKSACQPDTLNLLVSTKKRIPSPIIKIDLRKQEEDEEGATYRIDGGILAREMGIKGETCWLCNVTKFVFGCFPDRVRILKIY